MTCSNACELGTRRECSLVAVGNLAGGVPTDRAHVRVAGTLHRPGACAEIGRCLIQGGLGGWVREMKKWFACESNAPSVENVEPSSPECQPAEKKGDASLRLSGTDLPQLASLASLCHQDESLPQQMQLQRCLLTFKGPGGGRGKEQAALERASALCGFRLAYMRATAGTPTRLPPPRKRASPLRKAAGRYRSCRPDSRTSS